MSRDQSLKKVKKEEDHLGILSMMDDKKRGFEEKREDQTKDDLGKGGGLTSGRPVGRGHRRFGLLFGEEQQVARKEPIETRKLFGTAELHFDEKTERLRREQNGD